MANINFKTCMFAQLPDIKLANTLYYIVDKNYIILGNGSTAGITFDGSIQVISNVPTPASIDLKHENVLYYYNGANKAFYYWDGENFQSLTGDNINNIVTIVGNGNNLDSPFVTVDNNGSSAVRLYSNTELTASVLNNLRSEISAVSTNSVDSATLEDTIEDLSATYLTQAAGDARYTLKATENTAHANIYTKSEINAKEAAIIGTSIDTVSGQSGVKTLWSLYNAVSGAQANINNIVGTSSDDIDDEKTIWSLYNAINDIEDAQDNIIGTSTDSISGNSGVKTLWSLYNAVVDLNPGQNNIYLTTSQAQSDYLTKAAANNGYYNKNEIDAKGYITAAGLTTYLTAANADVTFLAKTDAASTYLTQANAQSSYLSKADAEDYLKSTDAAATYAPIGATSAIIGTTADTSNNNTIYGLRAAINNLAVSGTTADVLIAPTSHSSGQFLAYGANNNNLVAVSMQQLNPIAQEASMTQPVGVDVDGRLWTQSSSGSSGAVASVNGRTGAVTITLNELITSSNLNYISDAATDGKDYVRCDGYWKELNVSTNDPYAIHYNAAQNLTDVQQQLARTNINALAAPTTVIQDATYGLKNGEWFVIGDSNGNSSASDLNAVHYTTDSNISSESKAIARTNIGALAAPEEDDPDTDYSNKILVRGETAGTSKCSNFTLSSLVNDINTKATLGTLVVGSTSYTLRVGTTGEAGYLTFVLET